MSLDPRNVIDAATGGLSSITSAGMNALGAFTGYNAAKKEIQYQKDFAKKGIQWRVADAKAAGIHPLYALGAQTHSYNPVGLGSQMSNMGQQISKYLSPFERKMQELAVERAQTEIDVLKSQLPNPDNLNTINQLPNTNQPETLQQDPSQPSRVKGASPAVGWMWNEDGVMQRTYSNAGKQLTEDDFPAQLQWQWFNNVMPWLKAGGTPPPRDMLPKGYDYWKWEGSSNGFRPAKHKPRSLKPRKNYDFRSFSGYR